MFARAIGGRDTTSAIFQQGKTKHMNTVQACYPELRDLLLVFNNESATPEVAWSKTGLSRFLTLCPDVPTESRRDAIRPVLRLGSVFALTFLK